jgi:uncharacterized coiled-coil protein SlyX
MSIALEAKVAELSEALALTVAALDSAQRRIDELASRVAIVESTAMRKPGPKPKDSNG